MLPAPAVSLTDVLQSPGCIQPTRGPMKHLLAPLVLAIAAGAVHRRRSARRQTAGGHGRRTERHGEALRPGRPARRDGRAVEGRPRGDRQTDRSGEDRRHPAVAPALGRQRSAVGGAAEGHDTTRQGAPALLLAEQGAVVHHRRQRLLHAADVCRHHDPGTQAGRRELLSGRRHQGGTGKLDERAAGQGQGRSAVVLHRDPQPARTANSAPSNIRRNTSRSWRSWPSCCATPPPAPTTPP